MRDNLNEALRGIPRENAMSDLVAFLAARLDEDERLAAEATRKKYPRWRVWLRMLRRG